jgi:succinate dehydrogenase/fumarate reductase-like Fe-S protein
MGFELPVEDDPVKLHGLVDADHVSFWRAECMACGYCSSRFDAPGKARQACKAHARTNAHRIRLMWAEKTA